MKIINKLFNRFWKVMLKKDIKKYLFLFLTILISCKTTVQLVLTSKDEIDHNAYVIIKDEKKKQKGEVKCGKVPTQKSKIVSFKIDKKNTFQVQSKHDYLNGLLYCSPDITVSKKDNPVNCILQLKTDLEFLNDQKSIEDFSGFLLKNRNNIGSYNMSIENACNYVMGSLIAVTYDSINNKYNIIHRISQDDLGVIKMNTKDIKWNNNHNETEFSISGTSARILSDTIPMFSKNGYTFHEDKAYQLKWAFSGYGKQVKPESDVRWPTYMIMDLGYTNAYALKRAVEEKGAKVYYINQLYVVKESDISIKEAHLTGQIKDEVASIIIGNKAYTLNDSLIMNQRYEDQVIFFVGNEYSMKFKNEKFTSTRSRTIDYSLEYSIYNLNTGAVFPPELFKFLVEDNE